MRDKILIISQLPIWDLKNNTGKIVFFKTLEIFSKVYDVILLSVDDEFEYPNVKFYQVSDLKVQRWFSKKKIIGNVFNSIYGYYFYIKVKNLIESKKIEPNLIYSVGPWSSFAAFRLFKGKKFIVNRFFGIAWKESRFHSFFYRIKFIARNFYYSHSGNLIIMTNDGTKGNLFLSKIGVSEEKIIFMKNGIEFSSTPNNFHIFKKNIIKKYGFKPDSFFILTVSRLSNWKNVDRSIKLIGDIKDEKKNVFLLIVGDGEEMLNLKELAFKLGIEDRVLFLGSISHKELSYYYTLADVFISLYSYSNAGNPLFEAMNFKKAIITEAIGDTSLFVDESCSLLLKNYTRECLKEALLSLYYNRKKRIELGILAYEKLKKTHNSWDQRLDEELELIQFHYINYLNNV
jgi:glycosyltransferase involved in cell wall biosynthesis